jgi:hypothetical protein
MSCLWPDSPNKEKWFYIIPQLLLRDDCCVVAVGGTIIALHCLSKREPKQIVLGYGLIQAHFTVDLVRSGKDQDCSYDYVDE